MDGDQSADGGYLDGSTVGYLDPQAPDGVAQIDQTQPTTTTETGVFTLTGGNGPIVLTGGSDSATGVAFTGTLEAPAGSTVLTPLTTLIEKVVEASGDASVAGIAAANAAVDTVIGISTDTDLTSLDPVAGTLAGDPVATTVFAAGANLLNLYAQITAAGGSSDATLTALANAIASGQIVDLTDTASLTAVAVAAGLSSTAAAALAASVSGADAALAQQLANAPDATTAFDDITSASPVAQEIATAAPPVTYLGIYPWLQTTAVQSVSIPSRPCLTRASDTGRSSHDNITRDTTPVVIGTAVAGSTVTLYDGKTVVGHAVAIGGIYRITAAGLSDGQHVLHVVATKDGLSSKASGDLVVIIDTHAPAKPGSPRLTKASDTGTSSTDGLTKDATPRVTGTAAAGSLVTLYDGTKRIGSAIASKTGVYTIIAPHLADGVHTLTVTATDAAGNVSSASAASTITIDTKAPVVSIASSGGDISAPSETISGHGEVGTSVKLFDNGKLVATSAVHADGSWSDTTSLQTGLNRFIATDTDAAGNIGFSKVVTVSHHPMIVQAAMSLNILVQAMSTMPSAAAPSSHTVTPTTANEHILASPH